MTIINLSTHPQLLKSKLLIRNQGTNGLRSPPRDKAVRKSLAQKYKSHNSKNILTRDHTAESTWSFSIKAMIALQMRASYFLSNLISTNTVFIFFFIFVIRPKKKNVYVALTRPKFENWVGRSVGIFFFFFLRTVRELSFPIFFLKFLNGENSGGMQSKRIYKSCKCFFKPLNTNFSKFFAQIWHKKKKKKNRPCFFAFYGRSGEGNITFFFFWPKSELC